MSLYCYLHNIAISATCRCCILSSFNHMLYVFIIIKKNMFIHVKNAILTCVLVVRTILSLLRINASMPLRLSAVIQSMMIFFSLKNMFIHIKNAILKRALVVRTILSLLCMDTSMPLRLSAVIQSRMICFFSL